MSDQEKQPLQPIAEITLLGEKYDLAKNGSFALVRTEPDDYGRPRAKRVDVVNLLFAGREVVRGQEMQAVKIVEALLDLLGDAHLRLQQQRDVLRRNPGLLAEVS
jgi:hypothetical protein